MCMNSPEAYEINRDCSSDISQEQEPSRCLWLHTSWLRTEEETKWFTLALVTMCKFVYLYSDHVFLWTETNQMFLKMILLRFFLSPLLLWTESELQLVPFFINKKKCISDSCSPQPAMRLLQICEKIGMNCRETKKQREHAIHVLFTPFFEDESVVRRLLSIVKINATFFTARQRDNKPYCNAHEAQLINQCRFTHRQSVSGIVMTSRWKCSSIFSNRKKTSKSRRQSH